jgi:hypothetical protein
MLGQDHPKFNLLTILRTNARARGFTGHRDFNIHPLTSAAATTSYSVGEDCPLPVGAVLTFVEAGGGAHCGHFEVDLGQGEHLTAIPGHHFGFSHRPPG